MVWMDVPGSTVSWKVLQELIIEKGHLGKSGTHDQITWVANLVMIRSRYPGCVALPVEPLLGPEAPLDHQMAYLTLEEVTSCQTSLGATSFTQQMGSRTNTLSFLAMYCVFHITMSVKWNLLGSNTWFSTTPKYSSFCPCVYGMFIPNSKYL